MDLTSVRFGLGDHTATPAPTGNRDLCIMEAVAYIAGEPWSSSPACASPVVSAFLRVWNDALSDDDRDRLLPADVWVPRLVGSRGDDATERRRVHLALDWLVRVHAPIWFDLVPALAPHAARLRALPEITVETALNITQGPATDANSAWAAAWAAWEAARAALPAGGGISWMDGTIRRESDTGAAAREACGAAAQTQICEASSAWGAAKDARNAAWAAWATAGFHLPVHHLHPTVEKLQQSALDLLDRMLLCGTESSPPPTTPD